MSQNEYRVQPYRYPNIFVRIGQGMVRAGMPWWAVVILGVCSITLLVVAIASTRSCDDVIRSEINVGG